MRRAPASLSPRAVEIFQAHAAGKRPSDYLFLNKQGGQLKVGVARKFSLGFRRHDLRHYAALTWLRLGTPVHEVAEYLGDDPAQSWPSMPMHSAKVSDVISPNAWLSRNAHLRIQATPGQLQTVRSRRRFRS
ncbi:hypothetical protein B4U78_014445 [Microbacterium esteraromaticum]|nr:hypothetical protein B4U78_014445 [Microbacterium esteraromaticum]